MDGRGVLQIGYWADVVIFDLETLADEANYDTPFAEPTGIDYVIVNGAVTVDHGALTSVKPMGVSIRKTRHYQPRND